MHDDILFLIRLVETPSLSGQETQVAALLKEEMMKMSFSASIDAAGNAVGHRGSPKAARRHLLLLGHMDTVPGEIPVELRDGALYGRGSVDAKGPLATFVCAAARAEIPDDCAISVIGAVEEEAHSSKGAHHVASQYSPDACIIGEPSGWDGITLGYKGRLSLRLSFTKQLSHTAGKEQSLADDVISWWHTVKTGIDDSNQQHQRLFDMLLPSLLSVSTHDDGLHQNASLKISFRLPTGFDRHALIADLEMAPHLAGIEQMGYEQAWSCSRSTPLARAFTATFASAGVRPAWKLKTGTSDMNVAGPAWNCPILAYGPGDSALDHTPDEHIIINDYQRAIAILTEVITTYFSQ